MTVWHGLQLALAAGGVAAIAWRGFVLWWRAPIPVAAFKDAIETAVSAGQVELATRLASACRPAWAGQFCELVLEARMRGEDATREAEELLRELEHEALRGIYLIRGLARIALPLAFLAVIVEVGQAVSGGHGLVGLQRGLAASVGLERALLSFSIGIATMIVCLHAARLLQRQGVALCDQLSAFVRMLVPAVGAREQGLPLDRDGSGV